MLNRGRYCIILNFKILIIQNNINLSNIILIMDWQLCITTSDVANKYEFYTVLALDIFLGLILLFIVYRIIQIIKNQYGKQISIVHKLLLLWCSFLMTDFTLNLIYYKLLVNFQNQQQKSWPIYLKYIIPKVLIFSSDMATILLQTILIIVPYYWINNIIQYMVYTDNRDVKNERKIIILIKIYGILSRVIFISILIWIMVMKSVEQIISIRKGLYYVIIGESFLCAVMLYVGSTILLKNFILLAQTQESGTSKMKKQCFALITTCLIRFIFDIIQFIKPIKFFTRNLNHSCLDPLPQFSYSIILIILTILMHVLPVATLLIIYSPNEQQQEISVSKSMLGSSLLQLQN